jgi:hypothetical protein
MMTTDTVQAPQQSAIARLPKVSPITTITNSTIAARFWMLLAVLGFAGWAVIPQLTVQSMKQQQMVAIVDQSGNIIYAPLVGFQDSGQLHAYHVRLACIAMFQRNPNGFDMPELIDRVFIDPARSDVRALAKAQASEFAKKAIHQKVEIRDIATVETRRIDARDRRTYDAVLIRAAGGLIRTGTVNGIEFREPANFTIEFLFIKNPNLIDNGLLPLVVSTFKYNETKL